MSKLIVTSEAAPKAIGPYSQANIINDLIFVSGQLPIDPKTGTLVEGIAAQTKQSLANIAAILKEAGSDLNKVVKTTIFLKDISNFKVVNEIYSEYLTQNHPARSTVEVAKLPLNAEIEIEAIASL